MSTRSALDAYEARVATALARYSQASKEAADLPKSRRAGAEAVAFTTLQSVQQEAMRELVASEFAELLRMRNKLSTGRVETRKGTRVVIRSP